MMMTTTSAATTIKCSKMLSLYITSLWVGPDGYLAYMAIYNIEKKPKNIAELATKFCRMQKSPKNC